MALGRRGVAAVSVAGVVGIACFVVSLVEITAPLRTSEVERTQREAGEIAVLDRSYREVMRTINAQSLGALRPRSGERPALEAWQRFYGELTRICGQEFALTTKGQTALCEARSDLGEEVEVLFGEAGVAAVPVGLDPPPAPERVPAREDCFVADADGAQDLVPAR